MSVLENQNLARLHTKLVVPFAVKDIVAGKQEITPDIQYALHEALSEMDPDTALLAVALSALHITAQLDRNIPVAAALTIECEKIICEYATDWLAHADGLKPSREGDELFQALENIPEDLEGIADLLDGLCSCLHESFGALKDVAYIMSVQARAHREIADFILSELQGVDIQSAPHIDSDNTIERFDISQSNILLFPTSTIH